jgi:hypothetical protein
MALTEHPPTAAVIVEARRLLELVPREFADEVPLAIAAADIGMEFKFCNALGEVSPEAVPFVDVAAGNAVMLLGQISRRSPNEYAEQVRVTRLLERALVDLDEAVDEPDPRLRFTLLMMAAESLLPASVDAATERRWRFDALRFRRARRTRGFRRPLRPAPARRVRRSAGYWRPRSSRGPPDDNEDSDGDGPPGTGRAG